ncbi:hypothetical protein HSB1_24840 [Halogranum salarium B-1]|uniref:Uncharacterized protein n=1 Tax=Halogranum salarium B-1 TaxID=1210908 RepID=J3A162_9EURY|nr:hypothetical protein HSB1_24840 [Halogranum salarium B-1]
MRISILYLLYGRSAVTLTDALVGRSARGVEETEKTGSSRVASS